MRMDGRRCLGYKDDEITMLTIVSITTPEYAPFSNELNDKALNLLIAERMNWRNIALQ